MISLRQLPKAQEEFDMKRKGSITIFAALVFMLIASFLFALLEASRVQMLGVYADMTSELALESVFAEYQPELWERYHLLGLDGAYGGTQFSEDYVMSVLASRIRLNLDNEGDGSRMLGLKLNSVMPVEYQLFTDGEGQVFLHSVTEYMKKRFPQEAVQELYEKYIGGQAVLERDGVGDSITNAKLAVEDNICRMGAQEVQNEVEQTDTQIEVRENPLEVALAWKQRGVLGMVVEDTQSVSTAALQNIETLEQRDVQVGTDATLPEQNWYDRILTTEYMEQYFSDYMCPKEGRALSYETEYVICGEDSDSANLEGVAKRILLAREAANIVHIMQDAGKRMQATEIATALAGVTANPAIIRIVEIGVIGAWAYAESVLDVRALLHGDAVALIKSRHEWCSELQNLSEVLSGGFRSINCEDGWKYGDYLRAFLFVMRDKNVAYRMMDMMEQTIRQIPAYRNCRIDYMIGAICCEMTYEADTLFWNFSVLEQEMLDGLQCQNIKYLSYY